MDLQVHKWHLHSHCHRRISVSNILAKQEAVKHCEINIGVWNDGYVFWSFRRSTPDTGHVDLSVTKQSSRLCVTSTRSNSDTVAESRVHRVNIAAMADVISDDSHLVKLEYCNTQVQLANPLTKILAPLHWTQALLQLCVRTFDIKYLAALGFEIAFARNLQCRKLKLGHMLGLRGELWNTSSLYSTSPFMFLMLSSK